MEVVGGTDFVEQILTLAGEVYTVDLGGGRIQVAIPDREDLEYRRKALKYWLSGNTEDYNLFALGRSIVTEVMVLSVFRMLLPSNWVAYLTNRRMDSSCGFKKGGDIFIGKLDTEGVIQPYLMINVTVEQGFEKTGMDYIHNIPVLALPLGDVIKRLGELYTCQYFDEDIRNLLINGLAVNLDMIGLTKIDNFPPFYEMILNFIPKSVISCINKLNTENNGPSKAVTRYTKYYRMRRALALQRLNIFYEQLVAELKDIPRINLYTVRNIIPEQMLGMDIDFIALAKEVENRSAKKIANRRRANVRHRRMPEYHRPSSNAKFQRELIEGYYYDDI